jgi:mediator of RNA polymerase II transcription subunit 12
VQLFAAKLDRLLTWSVTPLQFGDHRPYVAATILRRARAQWGARAARRNSAAPDGKLQDLLFEWLDRDETFNDVASVALLFGELVRSELFSYASYVQRLIARCEPGLLCSEVGMGVPPLEIKLLTKGSRRMGLGIVTSCCGSRYITQHLRSSISAG